MEYYSLYLHIPFCRKRCSYCDFVTYAGMEDRIQAYVDALCKEINLIGRAASEKINIHSIYIGGGTPTILPLTALQKVLEEIDNNFIISEDCEISIEANPGTLDREYLQGLYSTGFNRLSLGMQSAHSQDLFLLERIHDFSQVNESVRNARQAGFNNLSLDLMYGIPHQTLERWLDNLQGALDLHPEHLSFYALTLENNVLMQTWVERGLLEVCDDDLMAEMYETASEMMEQAGYFQYEISNWARADGEYMSRHNLQYWRNKPYLGLGAGSHGFAGSYRTANTSSINEYIQQMNEPFTRPFPFSPANMEILPVGEWDEIQETMMVGLRLTREGVSRKAFFQRFGKPLESFYALEVQQLIEQGLLVYAGEKEDILRLSKKARLLGNQVFMQFLKD